LLLEHWPASVFNTRSCGQVMTGGSTSWTITLKLQVAVFPAASVAVQVTVLVPMAKAVPAAPATVHATVIISVISTSPSVQSHSERFILRARSWSKMRLVRTASGLSNGLGLAPLEELRDAVLGASWQEHQGPGCPAAVTIGTTRPLKAGSLDGTLLRVPDTPGNRAFFGSVGTGDDSSPFPQARALPMTCCSCRALFAMPHGPAGTEKAAGYR